MIILNSPPETHILHDYDIALSNGRLIQVTIDEALGDTIEIGAERTKIHLSAKKSRLNPKEEIPAENILVFTQHIMVAAHRTRQVPVRTPDDEANWLQTMEDVGGTVQ